MTRDDIIRMAREAGAIFDNDDCLDDCAIEIWARFAELVAAAEREACAKMCDEIEKRKWLTLQNGGVMDGVGARHCAEAIRARGER